MRWLVRMLSSSIGQKVLMAATGAGLLGFVFFHMIGNLLVFVGQDALNTYAFSLKQMGSLLWVARFGLLAVFVLHIATALRLFVQNRRARSNQYSCKKTVQATLSSRYMLQTGVVILLFVIYHLAHFTFHVVKKTPYLTDSLGRHDVYTMVIQGFQQPTVAVTYLVAMLFLASHISHALPAALQSVGFNHAKYRSMVKWSGPVAAIIIGVGNLSIPIAILFGFIS